jgi:hypothetical protein
MKLRALKDMKWSIDRIAKKFKAQDVFDVPDVIGWDMLNSGAAELYEEKPNKKNLVTENKAIESTAENKKETTAKIVKRKYIRKKKAEN